MSAGLRPANSLNHQDADSRILHDSLSSEGANSARPPELPQSDCLAAPFAVEEDAASRAQERGLAQAILHRRQAWLDVVNDGTETFVAVSVHAYEVVPMDIQMPSMDTIEAMKRIRALPGSVGKYQMWP